MSRFLNILLVLCLLLASRAVLARPRPLQPPGAAAESFDSDDHGRRFRVVFPPHDRLWVGGGVALDHAAAGTVSAGWRFTLRADFPDEEIWWHLRHEVLPVTYRPGERRLQLKIVQSDYLRHDMSSWILIPARRDIRLPAPFDVALQWSLGGLEFAGERVERVEVGRLAVMADFVRDARFRNRLAVGFEAGHGAERRDGLWTHVFTPFSSVVGRWSWEQSRGLFNASFRPSFSREARFGSGGRPEWNWRSAVRVESEWVPIAINDAPLSLLASAELSHVPGDSIQWSGSLGLRASWSTRP